MKPSLLVGAAGAAAAAALAVEIPATKTLGALLIDALPGILRETTGVVGAVGVIYLGWSANRREKRDAVKLDAVKVAAEDVANKVSGQLTGIAVVADKTHTLVNSNMGAQLTISAVALRRIASLTKDPKDIEVAEEAERLLADHAKKQARVDAKAATSAGDKGA